MAPARSLLLLCAFLFHTSILIAQGSSTPPSIPLQQGANPFGQAVSADTPHLSVTAGISALEAAPGDRLSIALDVEPRRGIHVYAPGKHTYQVIGLTLDQRPWLRTQPLKYPPSEIFHFKPLDERVEVYIKPFRLVQDFTILATPEAKKVLAGQKSVTIAAKLQYQACDDKLCYAPKTVPLQWTLALRAR